MIKTRVFADTTPFNNDEALQEEISSPSYIKVDEEVGILIDLDDYEVEVHDEDLNNNLTADDFVIVDEPEDDKDVDSDGFDDIV